MEVVFAKDKKERNPLLDKGKDFFRKIKKSKLPNAFYYFLLLLAVGVGFYFIMLWNNGFSLAYGGDYSSQYIPMGYHIWDYYHEWIRTGHFTLFDPELYLGANSLGSNTYYGLFSPFNIIIVLLPRSFVPSAVAVSSIVKLACAGLFFSIYMKKAFNVKEKISFICGIAYAFAGWGAFYLWYNNYQDILVFFPIVLLGIEKTIQDKKPWVLAIGVFFLAICNYVLMVSYIICAFFYAMFRFFQTVNKRYLKDNFVVLGLGVLGFAGGLFMSLFIFAPALMATLSSPKLETNSYGDLLKQYLANKDFGNFFKTLFSWNKVGDQHNYVIPERVYYPIIEFFFPPTTCRSLATLKISSWDFDDMAVSLWSYIPFIMFLVPALIQSGKEKKWSHYVGFALLVLTLFTPFMYFLTMGFSNGYARWTLFIVSSLIAYVGIYIDKIPNVAKWHIHVGFVFAIIGIIVSWILTYRLTGHAVSRLNGDVLDQTDRIFGHRFIENGFDFTNIAFIIELGYTLVVYLTLFFLYNKKAFAILATVFVSLEAIAVGNFVTLGHGYDGRHNNGYATNERFKKVVDKIEKTDKSYYRMYTSIGDAYSTNNSFINGYNSVAFFHSLYNFEVDDFTLWTGLRSGSKSVSGCYRGKYQDLDNLLGVKYYVISKQKSKYKLIEENNPNGYIANVPYDFTERKDLETDEYFVYENTSLNGFGYSYNSIFSADLNLRNSNGDPVTRYYIDTVRNSAILSSYAHVNEEDYKDIEANHTDITAHSVKPSCNTINMLSSNSHYKVNYYNINLVAKYYAFSKITKIPEEFTPTTYNSNLPLNYFAFFSSPIDENTPLFTENTTLYVKAAFTNRIKYDFYFIDKDNNIFMYDAHDDDSTDNTSYIRGFYLKKDVYKIAVCGKYSGSMLTDIQFYKENRSDYETRRNKLIDNPVTDVNYKKDKFTFKTNFTEKEMFIVSRVAYDRGWHIKATDNQTHKVTFLKVYKGNGGFVSFIAPKGDISYVMTYETPYLKISYILSAFAFEGFFLSYLGYTFYQEKKRGYHLDKLFREN